MTESINDNDDLLMQTYCDGELDPVSALEFERRMANDESLRARYNLVISLQDTLRSLPRENMPPGLEARVKSALDREGQRQRTWSWQALAASMMVGAILASSIMLTIDRQNLRQGTARQVVASHIRSLLAPQPFDIASSDRHTVKPWFTTRLPESPQVVELASQGFPLAGGRVDVIGSNAVATIVYQHAAHTVSLTTLRPGQTVSDQTISGYNVRSWSDKVFTYVAVSDLLAEDLSTFERAFIAGSSGH